MPPKITMTTMAADWVKPNRDGEASWFCTVSIAPATPAMAEVMANTASL